MYQLVLIIHILAAMSLIALVLIQQGKGATAGAAFGGGASQTMFGSRGAGSFLLKVTLAFVVIFFSTSIALNFMMSRVVKQSQHITLPLPTGQNTQILPPISPSSIPVTAPTDPVVPSSVSTEKAKNSLIKTK